MRHIMCVLIVGAILVLGFSGPAFALDYSQTGKVSNMWAGPGEVIVIELADATVSHFCAGVNFWIVNSPAMVAAVNASIANKRGITMFYSGPDGQNCQPNSNQNIATHATVYTDWWTW